MKAPKGWRFIASSADDSIGTGELLEGYEVGKTSDGRIFLNLSEDRDKDMLDWIEVYAVAMIPINAALNELSESDIDVHQDLQDMYG